MSNAIFKLMIFSIVLNLAAVMMVIIVPVFDTTLGIIPDNQSAFDFTEGMNGTISPGSELEDSGNQIYRVLDVIGLGFISRFINTVDKYMYGFVNMLSGLFKPALDAAWDGFGTLFFATLKTIIAVAYMLGAWTLWTGKSLKE